MNDHGPRRIHQLPPVLASQIAAGEVVERPASVAKELMENAIDAGATVVELTIEQGGLGLMRLEDDGTGIHRDDLALALTGQATSKIRETGDLECILSLGFRGEALASIGSVSRLVLDSRQRGEESGWRMRMDGGHRQGPEPVAVRFGTRVEVRDLFYNVPARRKFLRAERTEQGHVVSVARRLALSRWEVGFRVVAGQREILKVGPAVSDAERESRVARILGRAFMEQAWPVAVEHPDVRCWGWLGAPDASRSQADGQYLYLNGRMVRDRLLVHGIRQAFGDAIPPGRQPAFVLFVELDPARVDVNVHPTKHEVRFRDARLIHDVVAGGLVRAMAGDGVGRGGPRGPVVPSGGRGRHFTDRREVAESAARYARLVGPRAAEAASGAAGTRVPGVLAGRYAVTMTGEALVVVDLHCLYRHRVETELESLAAGAGETRPLPIPRLLQVSAATTAWVRGSQTVLAGLGIEARVGDPGSVTIHRLPPCLFDLDLGRLLDALAAASVDGTPEGLEQARSLIAGFDPPLAGDPHRVDGLLAAMDGRMSPECVVTLSAEELAGRFPAPA